MNKKIKVRKKDSSVRMQITERINFLFGSHDFKSKLIVKHLNISPQLWYGWRKGKCCPSIIQLEKLADFYQVDIKYFFLD